MSEIEFSYRNVDGELQMILVDEKLGALVELFNLLFKLDPEDPKTAWSLTAKREELIKEIIEGLEK